MKNKKLVLNKETIKSVSKIELKSINGGSVNTKFTKIASCCGKA